MRKILLIIILFCGLYSLAQNNKEFKSKNQNTEKKYIEKKINYNRKVYLFSKVENVPTTFDCTSVNKEELRKCMEENIKNSIVDNLELENEIQQLEFGKYRLSSDFIIDKKGNVINIKVQFYKIGSNKTINNSIKEKIIELLKKQINELPKMKPGNQNGKNVNVFYSFPMTFNIEQ